MGIREESQHPSSFCSFFYYLNGFNGQVQDADLHLHAIAREVSSSVCVDLTLVFL